jgi:threonylcarbamoyladenosine tRNA methylthiotransferase CDKAL1
VRLEASASPISTPPGMEPVHAMPQSSSTCATGNIDDLEDLIPQGSGDVLQRPVKTSVVPKRARRRPAAQKVSSTAVGSVPGTQTVHVKTWGCSHNNSDGEYMAGMLQSYGYTVTDKMEDAELWVLNSCTVKNPSESHFVTTIRQAKQAGKRVVVAGCVPQGDRKNRDLEGLSVIGVQQIDRVVEVVEETLKGNTVQLFGHRRTEAGKKSGGARLALPKIRKNRLVEIIPINTGCLNQCTYCKTVHARGSLGSYPPEEIVERVRAVIDEGVREIWITSEDLGCYGRDIGTSLPEMLWQLVDLLPEGTMMRLGMTNPPYILEHRVEIAKILQHPRVYEFIHIPVQSGSDQVLSDMRRQYSVADFSLLVDYLWQHVPGMTIATDVICGFPTESDDDFAGTVALVEKYQFPVLYISQFYPRPGTPAAAMKQAQTQIKKQRSRMISAIFKSQREGREAEKLQKQGTRHWVLVTDRAADGVHLVSHNKAYEQVLLPDLPGLMGAWVEVKVTVVGKFHLMAELCDKDWRAKQVDLGLVAVAPSASSSAPTHGRSGSRLGIGSVDTSPDSPSRLNANGGEWDQGNMSSAEHSHCDKPDGAATGCNAATLPLSGETKNQDCCAGGGDSGGCCSSEGGGSQSVQEPPQGIDDSRTAAAAVADGRSSFDDADGPQGQLLCVGGSLVFLLLAVQVAELSGWIK